MANDNKTLGNFKLDGIMPAPRGVPQIEVTFDIDANGIVKVSAKDLGTGKEQHITITASTNLSDEEIEKAVKEAEQFAAEDKKRKEAIDAKNEADSMVFQTEKMLKDMEDKLEADDKAKVDTALNKLKELNDKAVAAEMTEAQVEELKAAKEELTQVFYAISEKLYSQAAPNGADMNAAGGNTQADDDVIDADFKEE